MPLPPVRAMVAAPAIWLIRAYQLVVSPMRPPTCRFYPSCSAYALTAIERFGLLRGSWLAARRLLRCHPWTPGGVDHVPHGVGSHDRPKPVRPTQQT
jgi:putative membrane protein insertion efficiency factor